METGISLPALRGGSYGVEALEVLGLHDPDVVGDVVCGMVNGVVVTGWRTFAFCPRRPNSTLDWFLIHSAKCSKGTGSCSRPFFSLYLNHFRFNSASRRSKTFSWVVWLSRGENVLEPPFLKH